MAALTSKQKTGIAATGLIAGVSALALAVAGLKPDEGKVNYTYLDIVKVPTECFGHVDYKTPLGTKFTDAQCEALLSTDVQAKLQAVETCVPALKAPERVYQLAASTRLAFNVGAPAFCGSGSARSFNAGKWAEGCQRFSGWVKAGGRVINGLVQRRKREIAQCMTGL